VKSVLKYDDIVAFNEIDESMLFVNPSRPTSFEDVSKRLRFANTLGGVTQDVLEKSIHSIQSRLVVRLPVAIVLPTNGSKNETHQDSSCSSR
jgi:hypothetical protein